jgi:hypothetical protein
MPDENIFIGHFLSGRYGIRTHKPLLGTDALAVRSDTVTATIHCPENCA